MSRIGIFIDTADLYHRSLRTLEGKISYSDLMERIREMGEVKVAIAYGMRTETDSNKFTYCLYALGFKTLFKKPHITTIGSKVFKQCDWNVQIAIDVLKSLEEVDIIIIGSTSGALIPLLRRLIELGWKDKVKVLGINASDVIKKIVGVDNVIELDDNFIEGEFDEVD